VTGWARRFPGREGSIPGLARPCLTRVSGHLFNRKRIT